MIAKCIERLEDKTNYGRCAGMHEEAATALRTQNEVINRARVAIRKLRRHLPANIPVALQREAAVANLCDSILTKYKETK